MCDHERLRTVGDDVFCCICGEKLPLEFLMNKGKPVEPDPVQEEQTKPAAEPEKPEEKPKKATAKRTTKTKKDGE